MRIAPDPELIERARGGDLTALEALLRDMQRPLYNLSVRMLGHRADAEDATQEILLKVTTHLATWRGESAFGTWVHGIAAHHLLNARGRTPRRREISFEALSEGLDRGLALAEASQPRALSPEDRLEARRTALSCTQAMLMCLDPPGRLAYVLDILFGLESREAAALQGISPAAHRQRLSRARATLHGRTSEQNWRQPLTPLARPRDVAWRHARPLSLSPANASRAPARRCMSAATSAQ